MSAATSKQIRENLKTAGYGARDVSVRNDSYSMGSTVRVRIKRARVALNEVSRIATRSERVSRDASTGEILGGGNTFVDVSYEHGALDEHTAVAQAQIDAGRDTFGEFTITVDVSRGDTLGIWRMAANGVGAHVLTLCSGNVAAGLVRLLATHGRLALLDAPTPTPAEITALAQAWQRAYPCPEDCPELAALWMAVATVGAP